MPCSRLVRGVDVEEQGVVGDRLEVLLEWRVVGFLRVIELAGWLKAEGPGEDWRGLLGTILCISGHVGEADRLDILSGGLEPDFERDQRLIMRVRDVVGPVVGKEVEVLLTIDAEHGNEVSGVDTVAEEFDTHTRLNVRGLSVDRGG